MPSSASSKLNRVDCIAEEPAIMNGICEVIRVIHPLSSPLASCFKKNQLY